MIKFLRRAIGWWLDELRKPFRSDTSVPTGLKNDPDTLKDWSSEPVEPKVILSDRDLMTPNEKALWADIEGNKPKPPTIQYPPKVDEQDARDWVTDELQRRTGGLTRHPADKTDYPEPPNEVDLAAREYVANNFRFVTPFSHGYSMRYLGELLSRAKRKDRSLSTEDLMALRSRGLI